MNGVLINRTKDCCDRMKKKNNRIFPKKLLLPLKTRNYEKRN